MNEDVKSRVRNIRQSMSLIEHRLAVRALQLHGRVNSEISFLTPMIKVTSSRFDTHLMLKVPRRVYSNEMTKTVRIPSTDEKLMKLITELIELREKYKQFTHSIIYNDSNTMERWGNFEEVVSRFARQEVK
jgi:hypothetical protein